MYVLAIDPGPVQSALLFYDCENEQVFRPEILDNEEAVQLIRRGSHIEHLAIEMFTSYGMAVGIEVFRTCVWIGRFEEAWLAKGKPLTELSRGAIKIHLCGSMRAKDTNVRQALIDKFGPGRAAAVGTKKDAGPLYGIRRDLWSALAVAVTFAETREKAA